MGIKIKFGSKIRLAFDIVFWVSWILMILWVSTKEIMCREYCKNWCPIIPTNFTITNTTNISIHIEKINTLFNNFF